jgi:hypothetical protein
MRKKFSIASSERKAKGLYLWTHELEKNGKERAAGVKQNNHHRQSNFATVRH